MKELTNEEIKKVSMNILVSIDEICRNENIKYSLAYGTLLGAVRHRGFIPWDDDIDLFMLREDYNRFVRYCKNNNTSFTLKSIYTDDKYHYLFAKACDKRTLIKEYFSNRQKCDLGVFVDIFPIDYVGENFDLAKKNIKKMTLYRNLLVAANWKKFFRSKTKPIIVEPFRMVFYVLSRFINCNKLEYKIENFYKRISSRNGGYMANAVDNNYGIKEIMLLDFFKDFVEIGFEKHKFMCIKNYDKYLKHLYGNYMQLPPADKRNTHHTFTAYYKEK